MVYLTRGICMFSKLINKYQTIIKYSLSSGICFCVDLLLFNIINLLLKNIMPTKHIIYATILARIVSFILNYYLNRNKVFKKDDNKKIDNSSFFKYLLLAFVQMFISAHSVNYLYEITNMNEIIIKIFVDTILFIINYLIQKYFIFNEKKKRNKIFLFILAVITSISILYHPINTDEIIKITYSNQFLISFVLTIAFYVYYLKKYNTTKRRTSFKILSIFLTIILIFGYSIHNCHSFQLVFGDIQYLLINFFKIMGYYTLLNLSLNVLYEYLIKWQIPMFKENKLLRLFKKNPFLFSFITLSIFYLIYLIAYYPGVVGYDPSYQIKEVMGIPNFYSESAGIIGSNLLTNYNPIIHTLFIGYLFKLGLMLGNVNIGIFIYTLIQMIFMIYVLSYTIKFLYQEKVSPSIVLIILGLYIFIPIYPFYALSSFKDTYFALFFMLYIIEIYQLLTKDFNWSKTMHLIIISVCLFLFRHNGILTIFLSLPFFLFIKKNRRYTAISLLSISIIFLIYNLGISLFNITPTSKREVLSIPFQQTAALVTYKEDIIDDEDKLIINKIIDYDSIKEKYNRELSDPIKNTYKNTATNEDLMNYLKVWLKYFVKEPQIYLEATINNIYGYLYPNAQNWYFYHLKYNVLNEVGFNYQYNNLEFLRSILYGYGEAFAYIPFINLFVNIGFTAWIYMYLVCHLIERKKRKFILLLLPAFSIIIACLLGPVNTYYRYVIPYSFSLFLLISLLYVNMKKPIE